MEETVYKVTLANGTEIGNLRLNGNNFISKEEIDESVFENNCSPVIISSGEGEEGETHQAMDLIHVTKMGDEYWFALRDLSGTELAAIKTRSDIDYIALMCDVEL